MAIFLIPPGFSVAVFYPIWLYHKWRPYDVWFLSISRGRVFHQLGQVRLPFDPKNPNLKNKKKNMPGDIISHLCNHKWSYDVWFLEYGPWQTDFFVILGHFFSLYPTNNLKNQNFEKMIKKPEDTIILPLCTTNDNHMMYGSWDIKCDRNFFLI